MPRAKKKTDEELESALRDTESPEKAAQAPDTIELPIHVEEPVSYVLPVTIRGQLLVSKPVDPEVAILLSPYSPIPPKAGGKWSEREKIENKKRERKRWTLGKRGHYQISLDQLKLSTGSGYGVPSNAIMRAIQTANRIIPGHHIDEQKLNSAIEVVPHDVVKGLLRVTAKKGPFMKEDIVRVGHKPENGMRGTPSLTVRPAWVDWKISFDLVFVRNLIDGEQVYRLLMWAGRTGILEGRPSKGSALNWGTFQVDAAKEKRR